mgnify:CR=1 FL=1
MKMKEVCTACGLTERAVRFYVQEGLAPPPPPPPGGAPPRDINPPPVGRRKTKAPQRKGPVNVEAQPAGPPSAGAGAPGWTSPPPMWSG